MIHVDLSELLEEQELVKHDASFHKHGSQKYENLVVLSFTSDKAWGRLMTGHTHHVW